MTSNHSGRSEISLGHVLLYVKNVFQSRDFYVDVVGLKELSFEPNTAVLGGANGVTLGLYHNPSLASPGPGTQVDFKVADVDASYQRIRKLDADIKAPVTQPWGTRHLYLEDPEGRRVSLYSAKKRWMI